MGRGRKRRHNPLIPAHIDQNKLPTGVYYDQRGEGVWYTLFFDEAGNRRRNNIANGKALLSDLHKIMEDRDGTDRGTLKWLCDEFKGSEAFKSLSESTRKDYADHGAVLCDFPTKLGKPLGSLVVNKFSVPLVQRVIDSIASEGTPAKAVHCLRFLRRLCNWGVNRGHCTFILPSHVIEPPKQRKRRRLPDPKAQAALLQFASERSQLRSNQKGAVPRYLWMAMEIAYLCRLRGIEVVTLTDAHVTDAGLMTNRRKGSRNNIVRWSVRLRAAVEAAQTRRDEIWSKKKMPVPMTASKRPLFVAAHGGPLAKSSFNTSYQRLIHQALEAGTITGEQRFGLHDLKRRGVTDTPGTKADRQEASGHVEPEMLDIYDFSLPTVDPSVK